MSYNDTALADIFLPYIAVQLSSAKYLSRMPRQAM